MGGEGREDDSGRDGGGTIEDSNIHGFDHEADISRTEAIKTAQCEIVV